MTSSIGDKAVYDWLIDWLIDIMVDYHVYMEYIIIYFSFRKEMLSSKCNRQSINQEVLTGSGLHNTVFYLGTTVHFLPILPVRVEHIWVCPHIGVMMNDINKQENHSSFLELNILEHTVLIACAKKSAVQQERIKSLSVCACVHLWVWVCMFTIQNALYNIILDCYFEHWFCQPTQVQ